jgi:hypothetical protein
MLSNSSKLVGLCAALILSLAAVPGVSAATLKVTADTPVSFRATFTGLDTDPASLGGGNDFQVFTLNFWTVLVNLRGDSVTPDGSGGYTAAGFYEIQLTHSGLLAVDPTAPIVKVSGTFNTLVPGVTLTDQTIGEQPHGAGTEFLTTVANISFDPVAWTVNYSGSIAGDSDLDGDGNLDSTDNDAVVKTLNGLKGAGVITGREMGQIIKQTNQPSKPPVPNKKP